jgi:site-specific DNA-methyltransferase (adenine-specific)
LDLNKIYHGDALSVLKTLPSESIDCICTSPPYYGLRSYNTEGQIWDGLEDCEHEWGEKILHSGNKSGKHGPNSTIGAKEAQYESRKHEGSQFCSKCNAWKGELGTEPTPQLYIKHLVQIFDECKRVLKKTGSLWCNLGDSYAGHKALRNPGYKNKDDGYEYVNQCLGFDTGDRKQYWVKGAPEKSLIGIPERFVIAMTDSNWIRRNTVIWKKDNCMPSSARDRLTNDFEYFYFFTKNPKYYFETQYEPLSIETIKRYQRGVSETNKWVNGPDGQTKHTMNQPRQHDKSREHPQKDIGRIKRCVWTINTRPFSGAHFAVFPEKLVETPIKACCPPNGIVLDPFMGAGTTAVVAKKLGRNFVGIELNEEYIALSEKRIGKLLDSYITNSQI